MIVKPTATHTIEVSEMGHSAGRSGTFREWNRRPHPLYCAMPSWLLPPLEVVEEDQTRTKVNGFS